VLLTPMWAHFSGALLAEANKNDWIVASMK
jgi:hypothetical protein